MAQANDTAPAIDWRFVLANLHLNWPADTVQTASELRDAAARDAGRCPACGQPIPEE